MKQNVALINFFRYIEFITGLTEYTYIRPLHFTLVRNEDRNSYFFLYCYITFTVSIFQIISHAWHPTPVGCVIFPILVLHTAQHFNYCQVFWHCMVHSISRSDTVFNRIYLSTHYPPFFINSPHVISLFVCLSATEGQFTTLTEQECAIFFCFSSANFDTPSPHYFNFSAGGFLKKDHLNKTEQQTALRPRNLVCSFI